MSESPPAEYPDRQTEADVAANRLLELLRQGVELSSQNREQLIQALRQAEVTEAFGISNEQLLEQADKIWELDVWSKPDYYSPGKTVRIEKLPTLEYREKVNRMVAAIIPDLEFISVQGKMHGQKDDFSGVPIYKRNPETKLEEMGTDALKSLPEALRVFPEGHNMIEKYKGRYMAVFNHPTDAEIKLGTYLIRNPTSDFSGRDSDGGSHLSFGIRKDNKLFLLLMEGRLNPSDFVKALLHAGVMLNPRIKYMLTIFFSGSGRDVVLDPKNLATVEYSGPSDTGEVVRHDSTDRYLRKLKIFNSYLLDFYRLPGFGDPNYREKQLQEYLESGKSV